MTSSDACDVHLEPLARETLWQTLCGTGHYGLGISMTLAIPLTVFPGFAFQQPSSLGLTEGWLPVLAITTFNVADFAARVGNACFPRVAAPSAAKHAALQAANLGAAVGVVLCCAAGLPDAVLLLLHAALAVASSWAINVCFVGADMRAVRRGASSAVRERTGTYMQFLLLLGVLVGISLSAGIASAREAAVAAAVPVGYINASR